jgi:HK97 family phage major capsid protein
MDLTQELSALQNDLKGYVSKAAEEKTQFGTMLGETKTAVENIQKQIDALDLKLAEKAVGTPDKSLADELKENEDIARLLRNRKGSAAITLKARDFATKTTISGTAVGAQTTGVLQIDRIPGITEEARQALTIRDVLYARPTQLALVDFVKVGTKPSAGSMTAEGNAITENAVTFTAASEKVRTIATFIPATRQILDDFSELAGYITSSLPYYVNLEEELQLLSGDNTGENLHGLITQATAFDNDLRVANDTKIDTIGRALSQIASAKELDPTFIALNTADWWNIRLTKDGYGRYLLGDPQTNVVPSLFGVRVVPTTSVTADNFLVGTGVAPAAEIRDRMDMTVEISTEHADYFAKNLVAIRAEKRMALVVKRTGAFVTGTFTAPEN